MGLRKLFGALLSLATVVSLASAWTNPIRRPGGADPFVTYSGGYYYLMSTSWNSVEIARSTTVAGLKTASKKTIYTSTDATRNANVWAPEVHYFNGAWYVYFTAGRSSDLDNQRLHVLKGGATPWDSYSYAGRLTSEWAIDASTLRTSFGPRDPVQRQGGRKGAVTIQKKIQKYQSYPHFPTANPFPPKRRRRV
ncbi:hypothetical protein NUW58_g6764 [Xylaria curta]|uniref:Uncharacterized protein n=1 Tax=Xylaria curta TaxID=42375 RepID=A0ACC1NP80_9PEZI|nr:hypothetical protein NUW58_g6764 [Xylaria curta]